MRLFVLVASTGIEPVSGASETLILSIVLRGQKIKIQEPRHKKQGELAFLLDFVYCFLDFHYLINPPAFPANIFTAMASNITPKNFRTASKPAGPNNFSIHFKDLRTKNTRMRFKRMAMRITRSE